MDGNVGTVEKVLFIDSPTKHLIVLVHDIFEKGFVHEIVEYYRYLVSEGVWVKINF